MDILQFQLCRNLQCISHAGVIQLYRNAAIKSNNAIIEKLANDVYNHAYAIVMLATAVYSGSTKPVGGLHGMVLHPGILHASGVAGCVASARPISASASPT